jgi:DNA repair protein RecO (recombination protein O)
MKQLVTRAIVLSRTNYGEADRIVTLLTPDSGKLRLMAKGVRKPKSKLAGGIELFSISSITYIQGRGNIGTLISARLETHYGKIVEDIDRTMLGYDLIKRIHKATEDTYESEYFDILHDVFVALNAPEVPLPLIQVWCSAQILQLSGHAPNLLTDTAGEKLTVDQKYTFSFDDMTFASGPEGRFTAEHIKVLRILLSNNSPKAISNVQGVEKNLPVVTPLIQTMLNTYIRV